MSSPPGEFEDFYRVQYPRVLGSLVGFCGDRDVAEEYTQEAFVRAAARWERVRGMTSPGGWLYTVALNLARSGVRRRHAERRAVTKLTPRGTAPTAEPILPDASLRAAMRELSRKQQLAVGLFYVFDLPIAEVAEAMGLPENTVKSHLRRARESLRARLDDASCEEAADVT